MLRRLSLTLKISIYLCLADRTWPRHTGIFISDDKMVEMLTEKRIKDPHNRIELVKLPNGETEERIRFLI